MEVTAKTRFARISPKKVRPLLKPLKNMRVTDAMNALKFHKSKSSVILYKLVKSALSNAQNNYNLKEDNLKISVLSVDSGPTFKRYWFRSRGNADQLLKRSSHFAVTLAEINPTIANKTVVKTDAIAKKVGGPNVDEKSTDSLTQPEKLGSDAKKEGRGQSKKTGFQNIFKRRTTNK